MCACAVCVRVRAWVRACVRVCVCTSSSSVTISLSLSLRAGYQQLAGVTKKVTKIQGPLHPPEIFVNRCHSNVTVVTDRDLRGGSHRWRLHRKVVLGPEGVGTVWPSKESITTLEPLEIGHSKAPSCPLDGPERVPRVETADRGDRLASGPGAEVWVSQPDDMTTKHVIVPGSLLRFRRFGRDRFRI